MNARFEQDGSGGQNGIGYFDFGDEGVSAQFENYQEFLGFLAGLKTWAAQVLKQGREDLLKQIGETAP